MSLDQVPFEPGAVTKTWVTSAPGLFELSASARSALGILWELYRPTVLPIQIERFAHGAPIGDVESRTLPTSDLEQTMAALEASARGDRAISLYGPTLAGHLRVVLPAGAPLGVIDVLLDGTTHRAITLLPAPDFFGARSAWMALPDGGARFTIAIHDAREAQLELSLDATWFLSRPQARTILGVDWRSWQAEASHLLGRIERGLEAAGWRAVRGR